MERAPRIIGGSPSERGSYPFMVALVFDGPGSAYVNQFCGGTLIAPEWVLSAAHCLVAPFGFPDLSPADFRVVVGAHNLQSDSGYRSIRVEAFYVFPGFEGFSLDGDAVLIRLSEPVYDFAPITLNTSVNNERAGLRATATGWGLRFEGDLGSPSLLEVELPLVHRILADARLPSISPLSPRMLAAGGEAGRDTCSGDSGGPLFLRGPGGTLQIGITSFGLTGECGAPDDLGVYTRVSSLAEWITQTRDDRFDTGLRAYVRLHPGLPQDPTRPAQTHYARIFEMANLPGGERIELEAWGDGFRPRVAVLNDVGSTIAVSRTTGEASVEVGFTPATGRIYRVVLSGEQPFAQGTVDIGFAEPMGGFYFDHSLEPGQTREDAIGEEDFIDDDIYAMIYLLDRLVPGETYHVSASSENLSGIPLWLYLTNAEGDILDRRETVETTQEITFTAQADQIYVVWVENGDLFDFLGSFRVTLLGERRPTLPERMDAVFGAWTPFATEWIVAAGAGIFTAGEDYWPWIFRAGHSWTFIGPHDDKGIWTFTLEDGWDWSARR